MEKDQESARRVLLSGPKSGLPKSGNRFVGLSVVRRKETFRSGGFAGRVSIFRGCPAGLLVLPCSMAAALLRKRLDYMRLYKYSEQPEVADAGYQEIRGLPGGYF
jgi:hypothetical protein